MGYYCDNCKQLLTAANDYECPPCVEREFEEQEISNISVTQIVNHRHNGYYTCINRVLRKDGEDFYQVFVSYAYGSKSRTYQRTKQGLLEALDCFEEYKNNWVTI